MLTLIVLQNDEWFIHRCEKLLTEVMERFYECRFSATMNNLNLITGNIILKNVSGEDVQHGRNAWSWSAQQVEVSWSWKDLLLAKRCGVSCAVDGFSCNSSFSRAHGTFTFAIMPHFILLTAPSVIDIPFDFAALFVRNGQVSLQEQGNNEQAFVLSAHISGEVLNNVDAVRAFLILNEGRLQQGERILFEKLEVKNNWKNSHTTLDAQFFLPLLPHNVKKIKIYSEGDLEVGGHCSVITEDGSCSAQIHSDYKKDLFGDISWIWQNIKNTASWRYDFQKEAFIFSWTDVMGPEFLQQMIHTLKGTIKGTECELLLLGNEHTGEIVCSFDPEKKPALIIKKIMYTRDAQPIVSCAGNEHGFGGIITNNVMHKLAQLSGFDFQGEGSLSYKGNIVWPLLNLNLEMHTAHIRIPQTYSIIQKIAADLQIDVPCHSLSIKNAQIDLYKGSVSSSSATILCDEQGALSFLHLPLMMKKCFFGWKKDLFAQVSGALMVSMYTPKETLIAGSFTVDQAHIRGNVLSSEFQQDFFGTVLQMFSSPRFSSKHDHTCWCDIFYRTRSPVEIKTPFLEGAVICEGHFGGSVNDPHITGTISFIRGTLSFPYKPLFITKGIVTVRPQALDDPAIDLIARGHIKKYDIELTVTGSVRNPHIVFSSSPFLEQANIITLLLGGSEDGSLYFLMPKVITTTLESLLFGPAHTTSRVQKYLQSLVRPFKGVTITPLLSDQEGRGGVRGALSFEVNDRLRAMIAKNVSLSEDSTFEVEYDISDDSSFRAMRDERGDLGLEGEMRWKF